MLSNTGIYAVKKRKKPVQKPKKAPGSDGVVKSNPSKRHRDRLNGELDRLTDMLPFNEDVRTRLDKLSVLRLSVGYLKVKSYFKATMKKSSVMFPGGNNGLGSNGMDTAGLSEGDLLLQALNGFVMVVTADGLVFYVSATIQDYLGFHQSDVVHQSVYDLIHTDDRAVFRQQLHFALNPKPFTQEPGSDAMPGSSDTVNYDPDHLPPENSSFLERSFVCRFRCLLDNSSGFLALKFQGRLKYLHGQSVVSEDGTRLQPQLSFFTVAMPVQPPSILEIRTKTLIFQTKHKLDFTPMGIDNRGKVVLGYSEIELCMRGSGYQFIHAADMMYCADNHLRMIKTGESGLTAFRLLTKTGGWVWVQANAKLVYKGGRPDFIIARQRALVNAEGEEHLRQRRLQLPFNFTTGEALLYDSGPSLDVTQFQGAPPGGPPGGPPMPDPAASLKNTTAPKSLLDCFLNQDEAVYSQPVEPPLPIDQVFMDSRALVNVPSNSWREGGEEAGLSGGLVQVKEESEPSMAAMMDALGKMVEDGELCEALRGLDVDPAELMEWENALQKASQDDTKSELDSILTNDILNYMDNVLFKDTGDQGLDGQSSCFAAVNNNNNNQGLGPFAMLGPVVAPPVPPAGPTRQQCDPQLFQGQPAGFGHHPHGGGVPANGNNGLYVQQQQGTNGGPVAGGNMPGQSLLEPAAGQQTFSVTQKLSHYGPLPSPSDSPSLQSLQLPDIFSPSIELPELALPAADPAAPGGNNNSNNGGGGGNSGRFRSCGQAPLGHHVGHGMQPSSQQLQNMQNHQAFQQNGPAAALLQLQHSSVQQQQQQQQQQLYRHHLTHVAPGLAAADALPSLIPCGGGDFPSAQQQQQQQQQLQLQQQQQQQQRNNVPNNPFPAACLQQGGAGPFQAAAVAAQQQQQSNNHRVQQWLHGQQQQQQQLLSPPPLQNGHKLLPGGGGGGGPPCPPGQGQQRLPPLPPYGGGSSWPSQSVNGLNHAQQQQSQQHATPPPPPSSCMFDKRSLPGHPGAGDGSAGGAGGGSASQAPYSVSLCQGGSGGGGGGGNEGSALDQSPPQGSCYFQWGGGTEPMVQGTSAITQESATVSPPTAAPPHHHHHPLLTPTPSHPLLTPTPSHPLLAPSLSSPEELLAMQRYLECNEQTQVPSLPAENNGLFSLPPLVDGNVYFSEQTQTNCCNF